MNLAQEADIISRYLIGEPAAPDEAARYEAAHAMMPLALNAREKRLFDLALRHPALLGCVDGALALVASDSPIRRKIFVMLAILEASPRHCDAFFDLAHSAFGTVLSLGWIGLRASVRAAIGLVLAAGYGVLRP